MKKVLKFRGMDQDGNAASLVSENGEEFRVSYDFLESVVQLMLAQRHYQEMSRKVSMMQTDAEIVPLTEE
jgi:hypothetical protein